MTEKIYSSIGKFIVEYERVQAILKSIIGQNSLIPHLSVGVGKDLSASETNRRFKKYLLDNYPLNVEKNNEEFNLLVNKINELNNLRNEILHGLVTPSLTDNNQLAIIFSFHRLYKDDSFNITTSKIALDQMYKFGWDAHKLYKELLKILNNKLINFGSCIFDELNFDLIKKLKFIPKPVI